MSNHIDLDRLHARLLALTFDLGHQDLGEQVNALVAVVRADLALDGGQRALRLRHEALAPFRAKEPT